AHVMPRASAGRKWGTITPFSRACSNTAPGSVRPAERFLRATACRRCGDSCAYQPFVPLKNWLGQGYGRADSWRARLQTQFLAIRNKAHWTFDPKFAVMASAGWVLARARASLTRLEGSRLTKGNGAGWFTIFSPTLVRLRRSRQCRSF